MRERGGREGKRREEFVRNRRKTRYELYRYGKVHKWQTQKNWNKSQEHKGYKSSGPRVAGMSPLDILHTLTGSLDL